MELFKEYNKVKHVFVKPKIHWSFGLWRKNNCLPVWRRGPILHIGKYKHRYETRNQVMIPTGKTPYTNSKGEISYTNTYDWGAKHKLPKCVGTFNHAFRRDIRKKLKKFGLGWLKPTYELPMWLSFGIWDLDIMWKTKWHHNDIRFEFPPQFTIVFFGLAFSIWLSAPERDIIGGEGYWTGLLGYIYSDATEDKMYNALITASRWGSNDKYEFALKESVIKPQYQHEYQRAVQKYFDKYGKETSEGI